MAILPRNTYISLPARSNIRGSIQVSRTSQIYGKCIAPKSWKTTLMTRCALTRSKTLALA